MSWNYVGRIQASKSMLNRALIIQSFSPSLRIQGDSQAEDVLNMRRALMAVAKSEVIECGHAGTVLRFLALRAAREPGLHVLKGSRRLMQRPQRELVRTLQQLSCDVEQSAEGLRIRSHGWRLAGDALHVSCEESSQFLSGVLLSSWRLPFDLCVSQSGESEVSRGYTNMTISMLRQAGMRIEAHGREIFVPKGQEVRVTELEVEPDLSSAFVLAAIAAVCGQVRILDFPERSLQPDFQFLDCLRSMGVPIQVRDGVLSVSRAEELQPLQVNLRDAPDLFPVLAALCAWAEGASRLEGAPHLQAKESQRISKTAELLTHCGRAIEVLADGLVIGGSRLPRAGRAFQFDPDQDHRMAMAAAVMKMAGEGIEILHPEVVQKSFPGFWSLLAQHS